MKLSFRELVEQVKDPSHVAAGLKAAVHNPHVSEGAKESALERLHDMGEDVEPPQETSMLTLASLGGTFYLLTDASGRTRRKASRSPGERSYLLRSFSR